MRLITVLLLLLLLLAACENEESAGDGTAQAARTATATPTPEIGVTLVTKAPPTAQLIQTTPTPLPTATATPTATPVIYNVEEGDTLLGIAIANYTTVEEIEALNPGVVPELLQIGQALELPPPAAPVYSGAEPTAIPLQIQVRDVKMARTSVGSMWVLGEVTNEGEFAATGVRVQIDLFGDGGKAMATMTAWVAPAVIAAGETAPFAALLQEAPSGDVQPSVAVVAGEGLAHVGTYYLDLAVSAPEVTIDDGQVALSGVVENVGQATAGRMAVVATFYDAQGSVSGYAQQLLEGPLAPGEATSFALEAAPPGAPTEDYSLDVYGVIQQE